MKSPSKHKSHQTPLSPFTFFTSLSFSAMASKIATSAFSLALLLMLVGFGSSNLDQDRTECADQLVGLATCLPYVGGDAKTPTLDCCTGLKQVLSKSMKCLCILIKDRDDPNLGLKINATLALGLPTSCHTPVNVSECVSLLHLSPNSTDAKVFLDYSNQLKKKSPPPASVSANATSGASSAAEKSDAGERKRWLGAEMACGILLWFFTSCPPFYV